MRSFLEQIIRQAGQLSLEYRDNLAQLDITRKSPKDLVTQADQAVETFLIDAIGRAYRITPSSVRNMAPKPAPTAAGSSTPSTALHRLSTISRSMPSALPSNRPVKPFWPRFTARFWTNCSSPKRAAASRATANPSAYRQPPPCAIVSWAPALPAFAATWNTIICRISAIWPALPEASADTDQLPWTWPMLPAGVWTGSGN